MGQHHSKQRNAQFAFLYGRFNDTQVRWSILEEEAFAILATAEKMQWILATAQGFVLFTYHKNLIFMFDPLSVQPDLSTSSGKEV